MRIEPVERIHPLKSSKDKTPDFMMGSEQRQRETFKMLLEQQKQQLLQQQQQQSEDRPKTLVRRFDRVEISSEGRRLYERSKQTK